MAFSDNCSPALPFLAFLCSLDKPILPEIAQAAGKLVENNVGGNTQHTSGASPASLTIGQQRSGKFYFGDDGN